MSAQIVSDLMAVWRFVNARTGIPLSHTMKCLGLERDGRLVAGVLYENWNGVNVWMHVAIEPSEYLTREYLRYCFVYPFEELKCKRVTGWVEASNTAARRFDEHLGFKEEARVIGAASDGGDAILYRMTREECRYLRRVPSMARSEQLENEHG